MKDCESCSRPQYLWGGETCDVCDSDGSGVNDRDEPIGIDTIRGRALFEPPSKGFLVLGGAIEFMLPPSGCVSEDIMLRARKAVARRVASLPRMERYKFPTVKGSQRTTLWTEADIATAIRMSSKGQQ